jgi:copper chaperone CopZ
MKHCTVPTITELLYSVYGISAVEVSVITDADIDRMYEEDCVKQGKFAVSEVGGVI